MKVGRRAGGPLACLERRKATTRINGTRSPSAGTALTVPAKQVRSTHEHRHSAWRGPSLCAFT